MVSIANRRAVNSAELKTLSDINPAKDVKSISGVRVYDVGQGDSFCVLDQDGKPFLQIDYGGWHGYPTTPGSVASRMPLTDVKLVMLSHWDRDHWCAAMRNPEADDIAWLTPRQITSPSAAMFAAKRPNVRCIPEGWVGTTREFRCINGDRVLFEKIAKMPASAPEDCNRTGVAFSILKARKHHEEAILLPGDAHFGGIGHFRKLVDNGTKLRALVAFHHGSGVDWNADDEDFLSRWKSRTKNLEVVFSYAKGNSYGHPDMKRYRSLPKGWAAIQTPNLRSSGTAFRDICF